MNFYRADLDFENVFTCQVRCCSAFDSEGSIFSTLDRIELATDTPGRLLYIRDARLLAKLKRLPFGVNYENK